MGLHESADAFAEPCVVNERLIRDGIQLHDVPESCEEERRQSIAFEDVASLQLSFRNVISIVHLQQLRSLTKLQLDNNRIERIENLDALANLEWLDLSFNAIEKIEGLENLTKLTDLSLFRNRVKRIENMDKLEQLQILSIGDNEIVHLGDVDYLRKFKQLKVVRLSGNPVCKVDNYRSYVLSRLDALHCLDYERIMRSEVLEAKELHQDELIKIYDREEKEEQTVMDQEEQKKNDVKMSKANLTGVDDLFAKMEYEDPEWNKLKLIPGVNELWTETRSKFASASEGFKGSVFTEEDNNETEAATWKQAVNSFLQSKQEYCRAAISMFEKQKKRLMRGESDLATAVTSLKAKLVHLKELLMKAEEESCIVQQQFNQEYETVLTEHTSQKTSLYATYFTQIRDLLNGFNTGINAIALGAFERFQTDGDFDQGSDEGRPLLSDKESLIVALQNSQDFRVNQIDTLEEDLLQKENDTLQKTIQDLLLDAKKRSRDRVTEILHYIERNVMEVEELSHPASADGMRLRQLVNQEQALGETHALDNGRLA